MLLSTTTRGLAEIFGDAEALRRIAAIGFDAVDYSMFIFPNERGLLTQPLDEILAYYRRLKTVADNAGIAFGQLHAPMAAFPGTPEKLAQYERLSVQALEAAAVLECPYVVVHPLIYPGCRYDVGHEEAKAINVEFFTKLMPVLRRTHVQLGIENMFAWDAEKGKICPTNPSTPEEMNDYIDTFNGIAGEELFVACLDIGHATLTDDTPERMVEVLSQRLRLLHVQDTNGVRDLHTIPYAGGAVNWDKVCAALAANRYPGSFSFEADCFTESYPVSLREDAFRFMHAVGRSLTAKIFG